MKAWGRLLCLVCAIAALGLPAAAAAKPGFFISRPFRYAHAHLKGSHGYQLKIDAFDTNVNVTARKGNGSVEYVAFRGRLRKDAITARLPGVGWVFLHFHELSRHRQRADNCKGPGSLVRRGIFTGRVRIRGERGYTSAYAHRIQGRITQDVREVCRGRPTARASESAEEDVLYADADRGRGKLSFFAEKWPPSGGFNALWFSALLVRRRPGLIITNHNSGFTENTSTFEVAKPPRSATVRPPTPFTGSAEFLHESGDQFSWLGDLAVELPGIGDVALAGPNFGVTLCIGHACKGDDEESVIFGRHR
ncbi:MAG: hypothetical protein ACTHN7_02230 [Solirubrobacterales bacterium]